MTRVPPPPTPGDEIVRHADWMEWRLLTGDDDFLAWTDYASILRKFSSEDEAASETDVAEDPFEVLIDGVASELQEREIAASGAYPFNVTPNGLQRVDKSFVAYEFMLALSLFGNDKAGTAIFPERVFEKLCSEALRNYLGSPAEGVRSEIFGSPRPILPTSFRAAVDHVCDLLGEGVGCKCEPDEEMKDAALDVVAWRRFPDGKPSQLLVFGQCATGENWRDKLNDLRPDKWCDLWLHEPPRVVPVPAFFLPRRIERKYQRRASVNGGLVFDRCRIAWLIQPPGMDVTTEMSQWLGSVASVEDQNAA